VQQLVIQADLEDVLGEFLVEFHGGPRRWLRDDARLLSERPGQSKDEAIGKAIVASDTSVDNPYGRRRWLHHGGRRPPHAL